MKDKTPVQDAPAMPGDEHRQLGIFLGTWHTTGEVAPTDETPAMKVDCTDRYEWYPGGFFLVHHAEGTVGDNAVKSLEVIGYDPTRKIYFAPFFDSTGGYGQETIQPDGNTWVWRGSDVMGVKEHRCFAVVSADGKTINARHEKSTDGKSWELWMDVTLKKQV